ncbi:DUF4190 domain-containing protein [Arthrobacter sp. NPDC058192]|uniref:DUF4190 domain-containing protein n=1 Tax=Arthrobacter sp. NPDC058192 TaxID=3346372 RepID=UPI0036E3C575
MTDQPKQGNNETPEGQQPTLRLPDHQPDVPRQPAPPSGQEHGGSATQHFAQPGSPAQPDYTQSGYPQQPYTGQQPGQDHYGRPAQDQGQYSSPYPPVYGQPGQSYGESSPYAQPGSYNAYGQPSYYGASPAPKTLSIASMCCGIAALVGFGFFLLPQLAAVILGHLALRREPAGRGMAIAGLVMGYVGIAVTILVLVIIGLVIGTARNSGYSV